MVLSAKLFGDEDGSIYRRRGEGRIQAFLLPLKSALLSLPCLFYRKGNQETVSGAVEAIEWGKMIEEAYKINVENDCAKFFQTVLSKPYPNMEYRPKRYSLVK